MASGLVCKLWVFELVCRMSSLAFLLLLVTWGGAESCAITDVGMPSIYGHFFLLGDTELNEEY